MNTSSNSYFKILLVTVAWLISIILIYAGRDHDDIFNDLATRVFVVIASIVTLIVFFHDKINYKQQQRFVAFTATITACIYIAILLLIVWLLKQRDNTPTIFYASSGKLNRASIDLRENKTFKITSRRILSAYYYRGTYILKDSLLILDSVTALETLDAHRYVIRTIPYNDSIEKSERSGIIGFLTRDNLTDSSDRAYLIPINEQGTVLETATCFRVNYKSFN